MDLNPHPEVGPAIDSMLVSPQNPDVANPSHNMSVLGGGVSGRRLSHEGGSFIMELVP